MAKQNEWGLVLSGGGGKGAFEAGVIIGLPAELRKMITAVSGASVGALNAVLFAVDKPDMTLEIWSNITALDVFTPSISKLTSGFDPLKDGIFERDGIKDIIRRYGIIERFRMSMVDTYVSLSRYEGNTVVPEFALLNEKTDEEIMDLLMASSALPIIFGQESSAGKTYSDGGLTGKDGNTPIEPLYRAGYRNLFVVHLHNEAYADVEEDAKLLDKYKDCNIINIYPHIDMGSLLGTLNFNPSRIRELMAQGKLEAEAAAEEYINRLYKKADDKYLEKMNAALSAMGLSMDYYIELTDILKKDSREWYNQQLKSQSQRITEKTEIMTRINALLSDHETGHLDISEMEFRQALGEEIKRYLMS